jgi:assimilatory nitrate reductase catalytic subunit
MTPLQPKRHGPLTAELDRAPSHLGLPQVPARSAPSAVTSMICGFCSTGCSLDVHLRDGRAVGLSPTEGHPVNLGMACPKGWESLTPLAAPDRATSPLLRDGHGSLRPAAWPEALTAFVDGVRAVQAEHGPDSFAFLSTGQIPTEEMALLGAVAKFAMGMRHGDGNTRQCMATSAVAHKQAFGFDAPPYTYADFEESDVIVLVGSNLCITHPIMWERIRRNPHHPAIVVVDPRVTETAMAATDHVALRPASDLTLLYGIAHLLVRDGHVDRAFVDAHTTGVDAYIDHVAAFGPERVAAETGVPVDQLERLATLIGTGERVSLWWTMGVNQSHQGVRTAQAIIALALLTANIGRPGTGANSITGQCNAMGSRLFSNTTNLFGGRDFTDAGDRAAVAGILGIDDHAIPDQPSFAYDQIVEGINRGTIRGLWVIATNSAHSWINHTDLHDLLGQLDLLVVQDLYTTTETAQRAHIVLPAAGWGEKEGTFINSERRFGLIHRVAQAPGQALADFAIFKLVADAWGAGAMFEEWSSPEAVFAILRRLSAGRPCDFTGIDSYAAIAEHDGIQWPYPAGSEPLARRAERRLFADGRFFTADGRARFLFDEPRAPVETPSDRYPFVLLTGRGSSAEWHTGTRTTKSAILRGLSAQEPQVELHPDDAAGLGIEADAWVTVRSARGSMRARAFLTPTVGRGRVFVPMHAATTNRLTFPAFDPHSRQPAYKHAAVAVTLPEPWD